MFTVNTAAPHPIMNVVFHPNGGTFAVAQPNYGVTMLDRMGSIVGTLPIPRVADYSAMLFTEGGAKLVVASARGITVCDTASGRVLIQRGKDILAGAVLADRGEHIISATPQSLRQLRISGGDEPTLSIGAFLLQSKATVIAISPCGRWGFGVYGRVKPSLLDLMKCRVAMAVDHPYPSEGTTRMPRLAVTFAPNGERFAVADGNDVTVFDSPSNLPEEPDDDTDPDNSLLQRATTPIAPKPRAVLEPLSKLARPSGVNAGEWRPQLAFTPDARGLLIRRPRNRVQLWDVATSGQLAEWSWRLDSLTCLAIAPDGLTAVAGARHGRVVVWDLE
ncbi:MAG: hypothetical protein U0792_07545 [Gemmataceae bacterium]